MKDIPTIEPKVDYNNNNKYEDRRGYTKTILSGKPKELQKSDIRKDVRVIMPSLDLFGKQNKIVRWQYLECNNPDKCTDLEALLKSLREK